MNQESTDNSKELLKKESKEKIKPNILEIPLPAWLPRQIWKDWVDHRKAMKKPLTEKSASLCIGELVSLQAKGLDPTQIINISIMRGWQGLFEPKAERVNGYTNGHKPTYSDTMQGAISRAMQNAQHLDNLGDSDEIPF